MAIAKLRFFNDIINPNPSNIYITNIKLYEVNNTKEQSNEYYNIRNAQGDIIGIIDKAGTQVVSYTYDSWGQLVSISGRMAGSVGIKNPYRYRGYRYDTETKLYYLQSRYYSPEWGRFINADGLVGTPGELLSANMFVYCGNNPINRHDPSGWFWEAIAAAVASVVALPEAIVAAVVVVAVVAVASFAYSCYDYYRNHNVTYSSIADSSSSQASGSTQSQTSSSAQSETKAKTKGKAKNKLKPDPNAEGDHTTIKRDPKTGEVTNYETWRPNPKNPTGFDSVKRYDGTGSPHKNPFTGEDLMPHVHDKTVPGGVRSPIPWEIPGKL